MEIREEFSPLFEKYYSRDEEAKKEYEEFVNGNGKAYLQKLFDSIPAIEKDFSLLLPQDYKNFVEAKVAWSLYGKENEFRTYDEKEIYEFNYIGHHKGKSSLEEMHDYFIFGQDYGECSYFFDPFNKLGYGIDAVWKINRGFVGNKNIWFDLISENFYDFIESCVNKKDSDSNYVFYSESDSCDFTTNDYVTYLANECKKNIGNAKNTKIELEKIKNFLPIINTKMEDSYYEGFNDGHFIFIKENEDVFLKNIALANLLYVIININFIILDSKKMRFLFLTSSVLKKRNSSLWKKKMFVFACNEHSFLSPDDILAWDLFFIDPTDKLGNGADAIYLISEKSKKLEEACYVAKDIVDLFRIFAEGEELNTTPIGKIK